MTEITFTPNRALIPPLSSDRRAALKRSIEQEGQRYAIIVNKNSGNVVDGGHRLEICQELGIEPLFDYQDLTPEQEAFLAVSLNRDRRQLTPEQLKELARQLRSQGMSQARTAEALGVTQGRVSQLEAEEDGPTFDARVQVSSEQYLDIFRQANLDGVTQAQVAANYGISKQRVSQIVNKVQGDLLAEQARRKIAKKASKDLPDGIKLMHGAFNSEIGEEVPDGSVSLILTDPPYGREYLDLWTDLGYFADRKLKDGGILAAYSGQHALPEKMQGLSGFLNYLWTIAVVFTGGQNGAFINGVNIMNKYNLILVFSKGRPSSSVLSFVDLLQGFEKTDKELHEWQQPVSEAQYLIKQLSLEGDLVVDPMMGSGTVPLAARLLGRRAIGFEIDQDRYNIARGRIAKELDEVGS